MILSPDAKVHSDLSALHSPAGFAAATQSALRRLGGPLGDPGIVLGRDDLLAVINELGPRARTGPGGVEFSINVLQPRGRRQVGRHQVLISRSLDMRQDGAADGGEHGGQCRDIELYRAELELLTQHAGEYRDDGGGESKCELNPAQARGDLAIAVGLVRVPVDLLAHTVFPILLGAECAARRRALACGLDLAIAQVCELSFNLLAFLLEELIRG